MHLASAGTEQREIRHSLPQLCITRQLFRSPAEAALQAELHTCSQTRASSTCRIERNSVRYFASLNSTVMRFPQTGGGQGRQGDSAFWGMYACDASYRVVQDRHQFQCAHPVHIHRPLGILIWPHGGHQSFALRGTVIAHQSLSRHHCHELERGKPRGF